MMTGRRLRGHHFEGEVVGLQQLDLDTIHRLYNGKATFKG
jgi:hypothetical protein